MSTTPESISMAAIQASTASPSVTAPDSTLTIEIGDGAHFRAALERRLQSLGPGAGEVPGAEASLGEKMIVRATELAGEMKTDQKYVSKLLEQATRTGEQMHLIKALMALNDYQLRAQFASKMISKATASVDQLTRMQ